MLLREQRAASVHSDRGRTWFMRDKRTVQSELSKQLMAVLTGRDGLTVQQARQHP
jgi:hypothetical protein